MTQKVVYLVASAIGLVCHTRAANAAQGVVMRFSYLIWDFDGTLFDTYPALVRAIERALGDFDVTVPAERIEALLRDTLAGTLDTCAVEHDISRSALAARVVYFAGQNTARNKPPFPGAIAMLERVLAAGGANYMITHRDRESLMALLSWYKVDGVFAGIVCKDDGHPRKPDPACFNALLAARNLPHEQALAVGDRFLDIQAAHGAGIQACLFDPASVIDELPVPEARPEFVVASYDDLWAIVQAD